MPVIDIKKLKKEAIKLLIKLINIPSVSKNEYQASVLIENYFHKHGFYVKRKFNNIWVENSNFPKKENVKTILLNSHIDTVKPVKGWRTNPFTATKKYDQIIGLGSNDAGGCVVSLISTFLYLSNLSNFPYKLIISITAEEEISGKLGIRSILKEFGCIDLGIIGEPTNMKVAVAEKGLMVLYCIALGRSVHSAKSNGINAIYLAIKDINNLKNMLFDRKSILLGYSTLNITQIQGGIQHNIIPDFCSFIVDIRMNDLYEKNEFIEIIQKTIHSKIEIRSYHSTSYISSTHPIVLHAKFMGIKTYGSPTLSDQSIMTFPTIKMGVGDSSRSHTSNEYILVSEIEKGIDIYIGLLTRFLF
ncbi:M20/M25/M40 family metallo-hydrolase [Blattabacterium cuenoti]